MRVTFVRDITKQRPRGKEVELADLSDGYYFIRSPKHAFHYNPRILKGSLNGTIQELGYGEDVLVSDGNLSHSQNPRGDN